MCFVARFIQVIAVVVLKAGGLDQDRTSGSQDSSGFRRGPRGLGEGVGVGRSAVDSKPIKS